MCGASAIHVNYCKVLREGVIVLVTDENTRKGYNVWTKELEGLYWSVTDIAEPTKKKPKTYVQSKMQLMAEQVQERGSQFVLSCSLSVTRSDLGADDNKGNLCVYPSPNRLRLGLRGVDPIRKPLVVKQNHTTKQILVLLCKTACRETPYPTGDKHTISTFVDQTHIQRTRPHRKNSFFKTSLPV